jgi:serine protease Do
MERFLGEERVFPVWGVSAREITAPMAFARGYPDAKGVVITGVRPGKAPEVAKPALVPGDVVREIGGKPVEGLDAFAALQKENAGAANLLVRFRRGRADMVTALDLTRKPPKRSGRELAKAWLGVETQVLTPEVARALGLEGRKGFRVTWVLPSSPAAAAALVPGDVIVALDGEVLDASRLQDAELLRRRVEDMDIGSEVVLTVLRDGQEIPVKATLAETPSSAADAKNAEDAVLEYKVRELTYPDKVERDWPLDQVGLLVSEVESGGWANVAGLRPGDLLLTLHGTPVATVKDFEEATRRVAEARPRVVFLFVRRERATRYVFVEPEWP